MLTENNFVSAFILLFILLNPFLIIIYVIDIVQEKSLSEFSGILLRACSISAVVFIVFALSGNAIFDRVLQTNFASFQIFGGLIFLIIGIRFVFQGVDTVRNLRGKSEHIAGSIAMPILIGPGSIGASIIIGERLEPLFAVLSIAAALILTYVIMLLLKSLHDYVKPRNEKLIQRYIEIMGRVTALVIGAFSVEMIMQGIKTWMKVLI
ncbi:MAG: MarC family protein [Calditrichae bacterium]|nr:MarC family protein [Calditrichota bacterium]MCB9059132.1 MarC family protein [Calditrichia bacterium]